MQTRHSADVARVATLTLALASPVAAAGSLGGPNWTTVSYDKKIDPQIAAGPNRILVTKYDYVYYFDKSGRQITHVDDDPRKPELASFLEDLFEPIRHHANANLQLPSGASCNEAYRDDPSYEVPMKGRVGNRKKTVPNYCLDRFGYDARVLYDEYRQRFVIVAVAINTAAKCKFNPESNYFARRNKILVAYSGSSDPTDGSDWQLKWFDAVPGESCPTKKCREDKGWRPGSASDYPTVAVTKDYLLVSIGNQTHEKLDGNTCPADKPDYEDAFVPLPPIVHVWSTKALSTGKYDSQTCDGKCSWEYHDGDIKGALGIPVMERVTLGQSHGEPYLGSAWFAARDGTGALNVWNFSVEGSARRPPLRHSQVKIPALTSFDYDNSHGSAGHTPLQVNSTRSLVQRGDRLYYADVGGSLESLGAASIRLVELRGGNIPGLFVVGRSAIFGEAQQGYGSQGLEVNEDHDIFLVYRKVGQRAGPGFGARFLVWKSGSTTPPGGHTLADDEMDFPCVDRECAPRGDFDTAGISLAPQGRVYVMQPFIDRAKGDWSYAVNYIEP